MMKRILFATDLDNTLLFSHRHRQPGDRCAELWNGAEQGFFTPETVDLLPQAARQVRLLPITTRSIPQQHGAVGSERPCCAGRTWR